MRLYITRHGKAQPDSPSGRDEDRQLRKRGERQARWLAGRVASFRPPPKVIYSSGRVRAVQTAEIIAEELSCEVRLEHVLGLGHSASDVLEVLQVLARSAEHDGVMLVGHNPQLEMLVGVLVDGPTGAPVRLRTGECAVLDLPTPDEPGAATLLETLRLEE
ncbi:MAG: phosphohistidine phosphatase SixA [Planctomycetota bacterium]